MSTFVGYDLAVVNSILPYTIKFGTIGFSILFFTPLFKRITRQQIIEIFALLTIGKTALALGLTSNMTQIGEIIPIFRDQAEYFLHLAWLITSDAISTMYLPVKVKEGHQ